MVDVKDLSHAQELLESFIPSTKAVRYTLERMLSLMTFVGNPQDTLKIIHIAGTSGKTSTAYYAAALLVANGFKVGLCVSPHIDSIAERAQINLQTLPEEIYCQELGIFLDLVARSRLQPTYFEVLVAFSFWLFAKQGVDYAVIEVGLGGLLDSTNVVHRNDKICIITDISYDHTEILGKSLSEIATQKAGIIYKDNPVFMHPQVPEIMAVIKGKSRDKDALLEVAETDKELLLLRAFQALPEFQQRNFSLAYGALKHILKQPEATEKALRVSIPARMEEVQWSGKTIILDGSHNEQKITALEQAIKKKYSNQSILLVVSFGENKTTSLEDNLKILHQISSHIIVTEFHLAKEGIRKSIGPSVIRPVAENLGFLVTTEDNPEKAFEYALTQPEKILLVTGSFYLLNHIRPAMRQPKK